MPGGIHLRLLECYEQVARWTTSQNSVEAYVLASVMVDLTFSEIFDQPNWIVSSYLPQAIFGYPSTIRCPRNDCCNAWETVVRIVGS